MSKITHIDKTYLIEKYKDLPFEDVKFDHVNLKNFPLGTILRSVIYHDDGKSTIIRHMN